MEKQNYLTDEEYEIIAKNVAKAEQVQYKLYKVVSSPDGTGETFIGKLATLEVRGLENNRPKKIGVIIKYVKPCVNENILKALQSRETFAYKEVLSTFKDLQNELGITADRRFEIPKHYDNIEGFNRNVIILEDLRLKGYKTTNRLNEIDYNHASLIMKSLGRFHALSFILKRRSPAYFIQLSEHCNDIMYASDIGTHFKHLYEACFNGSVRLIRDDGLKRKIANLSDNLMERLNQLVLPGKYAVICHNDCWTNNVLFKYENGIPKTACLIDYQVLGYSEPVIDISFYIFHSTDKKLRDDHYYRLLDDYHEELACSLNAFSLNVDDVYPKEVLLREMKEYALFGLIRAYMTFFNTAAKRNNQDGIEYIQKSYEEGREILIEPDSVHARRVNEIAQDFLNYGYL